MKARLYQGLLAVIAALSVNIIGWPGPHGGLQFLYEILWQADVDPTFRVIQAVVAGLLGLAAIAGFFPQRPLRIAGTWISTLGLVALFLLLLTTVYPPVIPVVLTTAIPFLGSVFGGLILAHCKS